jgi:hypothetical protein
MQNTDVFEKTNPRQHFPASASVPPTSTCDVVICTENKELTGHDVSSVPASTASAACVVVYSRCTRCCMLLSQAYSVPLGTLRWNLSPQKSCHATANCAVLKVLCGAVEQERLVGAGVGAGNCNKRRLAGDGVLKLENDAVVSTNKKLVALLALPDTFEPLTSTGAGVVLVMTAAVLVDEDVGSGVVVVVTAAVLVDEDVGAGVVLVVAAALVVDVVVGAGVVLLVGV